jgi:uncharacterized membrane protein
MMTQKSQRTPKLARGQILDQLGDRERRLFAKLLNRQHVSRDIGQEFQESLTFGQKISDSIASYAGSWPFVIGFLLVMIAWVSLNSFLLYPSGKAFDPYPYILLNLFLSMLAAIQAPIILMSQNRQVSKDRIEASHDYEVNLKAELEVEALHMKIDQLRDEQMSRMIELEEKHLETLEQIRELLSKSSKEY